MEKCRNCKKDIYFQRNILYAHGIRKKGIIEPEPYDTYHSHNHSSRCDDESYTNAEREGNCIHCGMAVIEDYSGIKHTHPIIARLFKKCKKAELPFPDARPVPDFSKAWKHFTRRLR